MKKHRFLKLLGLAFLTMIFLVLISVLEVTVYSYLVHPGQDTQVYEAHANLSAPWISAIFGFFVFFFLVRYWAFKKYERLFNLALLFFAAYLLLDLLILLASGIEWAAYYHIVMLANGAKLLGALSAYYIYRPKGANRNL